MNNASTKTKTTKFTAVDRINDFIIKKLEEGIIPWEKPWTGMQGAYSGATLKPYSFLNQLLLGKPGAYFTFKEVERRKGKVKKGSKGNLIYYTKTIVKQEKVQPSTEQEDNTQPEEESLRIYKVLKPYYVFHEDDIEGIEFKSYTPTILGNIEDADKVKQDYLDREHIGYKEVPGDRAYYSVLTDSVTIPKKEQFKKLSEYYSTIFHELGHSTGHKNRLDRQLGTKFGEEAYSKEELVAEVAATNILAYLGIEEDNTAKNSVAYIQSWIRALKNDKTIITQAIPKAEKAYKFILGIE